MYSLRPLVLFLFFFASGLNAIAANPKAKAIAVPKKTFGLIENKGQILDQNGNPNSAVKYLFSSNGFKVQLRQTGFSYDVIKTTKVKSNLVSAKTKFKEELDTDSLIFEIHRVDVELAGSNIHASLTGQEPASDYINYYTYGTPAEGVTFVKHYKKVLYKNIYPGIDMEFCASNSIKYNFIVHAGADLNRIRLKYSGAVTSLAGDSVIHIETSIHHLEEQIPYSYIYRSDGSEEEVKAEYVKTGENEFGIKTKESYLRDHTLYIDPIPNLIMGTYFGDVDDDYGRGMGMDADGNILVAGQTQSSANIATAGAYQTVFGAGGWDAFASKFDSLGVLQWSTYYGGNNVDYGEAISADEFGNVLFAGYTRSTNNISSPGAHQLLFGGGVDDAFAVKFDPAGVRQWGTYYGGVGDDFGYGICSDGNGTVVMTGFTQSNAFIATPGSYQVAYAGGTFDAYVVKFNASGTRMWGTYYGNIEDDGAYCVATDTRGNILVGGYSYSTVNIATPGAHQTTMNGVDDGMIIKFDSLGALQWCTYYGGAGFDVAYGICSDRADDVIAGGYTASTTSISSPGAHQVGFGGSTDDAFLVRFDSLGVRRWGTYYGGIGDDFGTGVCADTSCNVFLTGITASTNNISTPCSHQVSLAGSQNDAFIAKFDSTGVRIWGTYYGGPAIESSSGVRVDPTGAVVIAGFTTSSSGISTAGSYQPAWGGLNDCFVARFNVTCLPASTGPIAGPSAVCPGSTHAYSVSSVTCATSYTWTIPTSMNIVSGQGTTSIQLASGDTSGIISVQAVNNCGPSTSQTLSITLYPAYDLPANAGICTGDSLFLAGAYQTIPGIYTDNFTTVHGCDSIVHTTLAVSSSFSINANALICNGDSIFLAGAWQTSSGTYSQTYIANGGCDSVIHTTLVVTSAFNVFLNAQICSGDSILLGGAYQTSSGFYLDTLSAVGGCDSIIHTNLNVILPIVVSGTANICTGDSIFLAGAYRNSPGIYVQSFTAASGCDSVISTSLDVHSVTFTNANKFSCVGDSAFLGGHWQTSPGTFIDTLQSIFSCDSVVTTVLTFTPTYSIPSAKSICSGDSVFLAGVWQKSGGVYVDNPHTIAGCDSIITTTLSINPLPVPGISRSCDTLTTGAFNSYQWFQNGTVISSATSDQYLATDSGSYHVSVSDANGCRQKSAVVNIPVALSLVAKAVPDSVCSGQSSTLNAIVSGGASSYTYLWAHSGETEPKVKVNPMETTSFLISVTDSNQCIGTASVTVTIEDPCPLIVPNIFTPNGDGLNESFIPDAKAYANISCRIFNRWGVLIYEWEDKNGDWDGKTKSGKEVPDGTYYYIMTLTAREGGDTVLKGFFSLVRNK